MTGASRTVTFDPSDADTPAERWLAREQRARSLFPHLFAPDDVPVYPGGGDDSDAKPVTLDSGDDAEPMKPARKRKRKAIIPDNIKPELLTVIQAAAYLTITDEQVTAFVRDGELQSINVGRGKQRPRIRFKKADLDAFIDSHRQKEVACQFIKGPTRRTTISTSNSKVIGFAALRAAQLAKKPKPSKR
jgi:excisionase family DNA binding protein